ncbi:hypothetical protein CJO78_17350 (plasmid) [Ralstonia solanacearum]|nr:hypothetical protein LBM2029_16860 [Ralstonia solanacearum]AXV88130.1 hypothetical protein CJO78_17350 [Ralstonia solanacearum]AXW07615.1 hypothetical protein CJO82_17005 [Ralstonia solanacearum]AXW25405.1 hypothetical protein CJO86_17255 [Ralstonia solanacearum]AXW82317.1 hypothetical protein CJO98_17365 [Ralstonia solanacearum]
MLFGNPQQFAIEAMLEPGIQPPSSVWGRMRVWCQGVPLGDFSEPCCGLGQAYGGFKDMVHVLPTLWRREFEDLSDLELADKLDVLLYGHRGDVEVEDDRPLEACRRDWDDYAKHGFLTNWGEQFDRTGKAFLFSKHASSVTILARVQGTSTEIMRLETTRDAFCTAALEFADWFDAMAVQLAGDRSCP